MACIMWVVGILKHLAKIKRAGQSCVKGIGMALMQANSLTSK